MIDVNLLPEQNVIARQDLKVKTYAVLSIIGVGAVTFLVVSGILGYKAFQVGEIERLETEKVDYENRLVSLADRGTELLTLKKKSKGISEIESNRYDFKDAFGYVSGLVPSDIALDQLVIKNTGEVSMSLASENVNEVVNYIRGVADDSNLKQSRMLRLDVNEEGLIDFVIDSEYGKSNKKSTNN